MDTKLLIIGGLHGGVTAAARARRPVDIAGFAAANILKGDVEQIAWNDLPDLDCEQDVLIDLRNPGELTQEGTVL